MFRDPRDGKRVGGTVSRCAFRPRATTTNDDVPALARDNYAKASFFSLGARPRPESRRPISSRLCTRSARGENKLAAFGARDKNLLARLLSPRADNSRAARLRPYFSLPPPSVRASRSESKRKCGSRARIERGIARRRALSIYLSGIYGTKSETKTAADPRDPNWHAAKCRQQIPTGVLCEGKRNAARSHDARYSSWIKCEEDLTKIDPPPRVPIGAKRQ